MTSWTMGDDGTRHRAPAESAGPGSAVQQRAWRRAGSPEATPELGPTYAGTERPGFRPDIEGLRAVAILLVVAYHAGLTPLPGGYIGVDVFFVISGYLITSHLTREAAATGTLNITRFYAHRALRLLPAATLVIATTLTATWFWLPATRLKAITADAITANAYLINYRLAHLGTDYRTATTPPSPLQHYWSLAVEEQFYLLIPLLVLAAALLTRGPGTFRALTTTLIAAITAASLYQSITRTGPDPVNAYFGAPTRAWELGTGALLALLAPRVVEALRGRTGRGAPPASSPLGALGSFGRSAHPADRAPAGDAAVPGAALPVAAHASAYPGPFRAQPDGMSQEALRATGVALRLAGLVAIAYAALRFGEATPFPGYHALVPVLGAVAVIAAGVLGPVTDDEDARPFGPLGNPGLLGSPVLTAIGARSYSWYLWHWPCLMIAPYLLGRDLGVVARLVAVAVAFGLAALTYALVEKPVRNDAELRANPARAGILALGLTAAVVSLALIVPLLPARTSLGFGTASEVSLSGDASARAKALAAKIKAANGVQNLPANLTPSLKAAAFDDPSIYHDGCHVDLKPTVSPRYCESFGDKRSKKIVVLFGDSHAAQWFPAMDALAKKRRWRLAVFTKGACAAAAVRIYLPAVRRGYDECVTWRANAFARIRQLHPVLVVMSTNADGGNALGVSGSQDQAWVKAWQQTDQKLKARGTRIAYLQDTPWPKENVPDCVAQHPRAIQRCAQSEKQATANPRRAKVADALKGAGAIVVNPLPWFCDQNACPVVVGNILVYKDDSHISTTYAKLLAPLLSEQLKP
jgi:peptidoglycan/LPS O-acetylase OafA/YrhL